MAKATWRFPSPSWGVRKLKRAALLEKQKHVPLWDTQRLDQAVGKQRFTPEQRPVETAGAFQVLHVQRGLKEAR